MYKFAFILFFLFCFAKVFGQHQPVFKVVPLGVKGGIDEANLSAYMVAHAGSNQFVCLDAGTLHQGIEKAIANKVFNIPAEQVLRRYIKAYLISHSHLDHLSGLIINSPDDTTKNIYAFAECIETFKSSYFTWKSWANFADEGEAPALKKYHYKTLTPAVETSIENTAMTVTAYPLSHTNLTSTAFLLKHQNSYILYLGDTGSDEIEKSQNLQHLWEAIAPLIKTHQLKAMMIEVSFPNEQPDKTLFGHLTPHWLMIEMTKLAKLTAPASLQGLNVMIIHNKPPQKNIERLKQQLLSENPFKLNLIFPEQGKQINF